MKEILLRLHKARRILSNGDELSKKEYSWDVPVDITRQGIKDGETLVSIGKWISPKDEKVLWIYTKEMGHDILTFLNKEIVEKIIKSWRRIK